MAGYDRIAVRGELTYKMYTQATMKKFIILRQFGYVFLVLHLVAYIVDLVYYLKGFNGFFFIMWMVIGFAYLIFIITAIVLLTNTPSPKPRFDLPKVFNLRPDHAQ